MYVIESTEQLIGKLDAERRAGARIGFVPTMGNLHNGHRALIKRSVSDNEVTVVSIFVNPFQFGDGEDFSGYPRTLDQDLSILEEEGVLVAFTPTVDTIYPGGLETATAVDVPVLGKLFCGVSRPSFFRGVCTVVNILFNLVQPDVAYFGRKDYQQLRIIERMVSDLKMPLSIVGIETSREADGLAMSSRNEYLSRSERKIAPFLFQELCRLSFLLEEGEASFSVLTKEAMQRLQGCGFQPDYVHIANAVDLAEPRHGDELVVLAAAWLGRTRLIDNVVIDVGSMNTVTEKNT